MSKILQHLSDCYRAMLWLYPSDLREAYGKDMANVFEQLLRTEWMRRGTRGVAATSCRAMGELFTVAVPGHMRSDWIIAAGLSLVINAGILALLLAIMMWPRYKFL